MKNTPVITTSTSLEDAVATAKQADCATIDCGVLEMSGAHLHQLMKSIRAQGVASFKLINVCGQDLIGTGVVGPAKIEVYGMMGNHSAAFIDQVELDTYPTTFPNNVWCPGDAQVAIGNTSNPSALNIGGSVDDLFASYCPSGIFRVAGQGGNRCGLRGGAGIPHVWRQIDYSEFEGMTTEEIKEDLLYKYQLRKAKLNKMGFASFLLEFKKKVEDRKPPVIVFGRRVRDYFMEYAQGTIGLILDLYDAPSPAGYYVCSGMTAGMAFIRGKVRAEQLGVNVTFGKINDNDRSFISEQMKGFYEAFTNRIIESYQERLETMMGRFDRDVDEIMDQFVKIVPVNQKQAVAASAEF